MPTVAGSAKEKFGRIAGFGLVILGTLSILNLGAPVPVPTVGISAIVSGLVFIGAGSFILLKDRIRWRALASGNFRELLSPKKPVDPLLPVRILKLARARKGNLTVALVAMELEIGLEEAEAGLDECVRHGQASADYDVEREVKTYTFKELAG